MFQRKGLGHWSFPDATLRIDVWPPYDLVLTSLIVEWLERSLRSSVLCLEGTSMRAPDSLERLEGWRQGSEVVHHHTCAIQRGDPCTCGLQAVLDDLDAHRGEGIAHTPTEAPGELGVQDASSGLRDGYLQRAFTYHAPKGDQALRYRGLRAAAGRVATQILQACPESRERSLALTKLEECVMWANASIARNE